ncbi:MAG TPA: DNA methyltransferase, partial [Polyangiaceae bacterium]|nr:DNA methyltransferase [Polyangiaceae bacterium]
VAKMRSHLSYVLHARVRAVMMLGVRAAREVPAAPLGTDVGGTSYARLQRAVEAALHTLARGFVAHPSNPVLRAALAGGMLPPRQYLAELLWLVYRWASLLQAEEQGWLHPEDTAVEARQRYARRYSLARLRQRSTRRVVASGASNLWQAQKVVFAGLARGDARLGLARVGGIFAAGQCPALDAAELDNRAFLAALAELTWLEAPHEPGEPAGLTPLRWTDIPPELLGSVYESLLDVRPEFGPNGELSLSDAQGHARRRTGSYYTPERLVQVVLDGALEPVIQRAIGGHPEPARALLELRIVDPACGSGYFLLAAARRLAALVAKHSGQAYRSALQEVVQRCLYGVDLNPMAVELCRLSLWLEAAQPGLALDALTPRIRHGNSLLGATPELLARGIPDAAWEAIPGDDKALVRGLKQRNRAPAIARVAPDAGERAQLPLDQAREQRVADAWCAAFVWPRHEPVLCEAAPTNERWWALHASPDAPAELTLETVALLAREHRFFHWHLGFADVFARGGFDVVLGNPPWIAHAGRAAQPLPPRVRRFFECNYESFGEYPTTHGIFVYVAARILREGGYLGLVVPSSLSELGGYAPTRAAHDRLCDFPQELIDFGEGQFPGVTQPCMALVSRRSDSGRGAVARGQPWPVQRTDLDDTARALMARLARLPPLPAELFGERGVQSDRELGRHFRQTSEPVERFTVPIREGTDVRQFELLPARLHVDRAALGSRMRSAPEFSGVRALVRQTARYPIAALSDGQAFRNSLLAVFETANWPARALVLLLNSALVRWLHYVRFRDARQPILPQLKISHLRAIPAPPPGGPGSPSAAECLLALPPYAVACASLLPGAGAGALDESWRSGLDQCVFDLYGLEPSERELVSAWHAAEGPQAAKGRGKGRRAQRALASA